MPPKFRYGCKKSVLDGTEKQYHSTMRALPNELPSKVDLRDSGFIPPILQQGQLGSCVLNATSNCLRYVMNKEGLENPFQPSRLFLYYFTRFLEDTINEDAGCEIKDAMKTVFAFGSVPEEDWPYEIEKFKERPPLSVIKKARQHLDNFEYFLVKQDLNVMKQCLYEGNPIIIGIAIFESFEYEETLKTGKVPIPKATESVYGGHSMMVVSYNDETSEFGVLNSWGTSVGSHEGKDEGGIFYIPYDYILNPSLGNDFWTIKLFK